MPPCVLHHLIIAWTASPTSCERPGAEVKPRSSPNPIVIAVSVAPWSVAPFASPAPQGDGRSPKVAAAPGALPLPVPVSPGGRVPPPHAVVARATVRTIAPALAVL